MNAAPRDKILQGCFFILYIAVQLKSQTSLNDPGTAQVRAFTAGRIFESTTKRVASLEKETPSPIDDAFNTKLNPVILDGQNIVGPVRSLHAPRVTTEVRRQVSPRLGAAPLFPELVRDFRPRKKKVVFQLRRWSPNEPYRGK